MAAAEEWQRGFHRTIAIVVGEGECRGVLHDDFHHFRVTVRHRQGIVSAVRAETRRGPYSLCPRAGDELAQLVGSPLGTSIGEVLDRVSARLQCTHQLDLAALVIAAAARGEDLQYQVSVVTTGPEDFRGHVALAGQEVLSWTVAGDRITAPEPYAGRALGIGFSRWAAEALPPPLFEAALVLRRGFVMARSRRHIPRLDLMGSAPPTGNCWVQQPGTADAAERLRGVVRDYSGGSVPPDPADLEWLAARSPRAG